MLALFYQLNLKLLKMGQTRPIFRLFLVFFKQTIQFLQQINVKHVMSFQFPVLGIEPTTLRT